MNISEFYVTGITIKRPRVSLGICGAAGGEVIDVIIHTRDSEIELTLFSDDGEKIALNLPEALHSQ